MAVPLTSAKTHSFDNILWSRTGVCTCLWRETHYLYSRFGTFRYCIFFSSPAFSVPLFPVLLFLPLHFCSCIFQSFFSVQLFQFRIFQYCIFAPSNLTSLVPHSPVPHFQRSHQCGPPRGLARPSGSSRHAKSWKRLIRVQFVFNLFLRLFIDSANTVFYPIYSKQSFRRQKNCENRLREYLTSVIPPRVGGRFSAHPVYT